MTYNKQEYEWFQKVKTQDGPLTQLRFDQLSKRNRLEILKNRPNELLIQLLQQKQEMMLSEEECFVLLMNLPGFDDSHKKINWLEQLIPSEANLSADEKLMVRIGKQRELNDELAIFPKGVQSRLMDLKESLPKFLYFEGEAGFKEYFTFEDDFLSLTDGLTQSPERIFIVPLQYRSYRLYRWLIQREEVYRWISPYHFLTLLHETEMKRS